MYGHFPSTVGDGSRPTRIESTNSALYTLARAHHCSRHSRQCKTMLDSIMPKIIRTEPHAAKRVHFISRFRMIHHTQKTKHAPVLLLQLCRGHRHTKMPHTPDTALLRKVSVASTVAGSRSTSTFRCHAPGVAVHIPLTTELPPHQMRRRQIRASARQGTWQRQTDRLTTGCTSGKSLTSQALRLCSIHGQKDRCPDGNLHTWLEWYLPSDDVEQFRTERARGSLNLCRCRVPSLAAPALKQPMHLVSASRWLKKSHQLLRASPPLLRHCSKMWRRMILLQIRQWMMLPTLPEESPMPKPKEVAFEP